MKTFWCISVIFNPVTYKSRLNNYFIFRDRLEKQKINLLTVELTFLDQKPSISDAINLHSNSIMWQKERLINYAISKLPPECKYFAWLDADLLLPDGWDDLLLTKLEKNDFVQLFEKVIHLEKGDYKFEGETNQVKTGIIWQNKTHPNWLEQRLAKKIYHAEPGFAWAAKKNFNFYDKLICGGGDNLLVDCLLDSFCIHHYWNKLTEEMKEDINIWRNNFTEKTYDYLPINIKHLWHGNLANRKYLTRDLVFKKHNFDPRKDLKLEKNVWEWSSNKPELHEEIKNYFLERKEDE